MFLNSRGILSIQDARHFLEFQVYLDFSSQNNSVTEMTSLQPKEVIIFLKMAWYDEELVNNSFQRHDIVLTSYVYI